MALVPFTYFPPNDDKSKLDIQTFYINDKLISIKQFSEKGIGGLFWDCSSGCGLLSMACSLLEAKQIISTDLEDIITSNTNQNILYNKTQHKHTFPNLNLLPLEWSNPSHFNNLLQHISPNNIINYIIICECLYLEAPFDKLLKTMLSLSEHFQHADILFAYKKRYIYQEQCLQTLRKYYTITELPRSEYHSEFKNKTNYILLNFKYIKQ